MTLYGPARSVQTFALTDEGSACTLLEAEIAEDLGIPRSCVFDGPEISEEAESKTVALASREDSP